jgi:hypothetical protein
LRRQRQNYGRATPERISGNLSEVDRRLVPWLAVAGLALGAIGVATASVARQRSEQRTVLAARRIALIGDSYAVGLGPELAKLLPNFTYTGQVGA